MREIQELTYKGYIQSPQTAWISLILAHQATLSSYDDRQLISKLTYIYEFIKVQSNKQISQIYCDHYDQESNTPHPPHP